MSVTLADLLADQSLLHTVTEIRRTLHRHPEVGHEEQQTAAFVERRLRATARFEVFRPAPTSVAALLEPAGGDLLIVRADLDGLPILEATGAVYASKRVGFMHACGHDGHTAAVLASAEVLLRRYEQVRRPVLFLFQQAEERHPSGSPLVIRGLAERLGSDRLQRAEIFGFHLWPELPLGTIGVRSGLLMPSVAGLTISLSATSGTDYEADDETEKDALRGAVRIHTELGGLLHGRRLGSAPATLHIGCLHAGESPQGVATQATLRGTLRASSLEAEEAAADAIRAVVRQVAESEGLAPEVELETGIRPVLRNDAAAVEAVRQACWKARLPCLEYPAHPLPVSEDFGWYLSNGRGAYFLAGCGTEGTGHPLHSPRFDFAEEALLGPVAVFVGLACN